MKFKNLSFISTDEDFNQHVYLHTVVFLVGPIYAYIYHEREKHPHFYFKITTILINLIIKSIELLMFLQSVAFFVSLAQ